MADEKSKIEEVKSDNITDILLSKVKTVIDETMAHHDKQDNTVQAVENLLEMYETKNKKKSKNVVIIITSIAFICMIITSLIIYRIGVSKTNTAIDLSLETEKKIKSVVNIMDQHYMKKDLTEKIKIIVKEHEVQTKILGGIFPTWELNWYEEIAEELIIGLKFRDILPELALAVASSENRWRYAKRFNSKAGAMGLMQHMPITWDYICGKYYWDKLNPYNPVHSMRVGIATLEEYRAKGKRYQIDWDDSFDLPGSYNAGPDYYAKWKRTHLDKNTKAEELYDETRKFIEKVNWYKSNYLEGSFKAVWEELNING